MQSRKKLSGVTLTELLVVLTIVGLLATLALPAVINRQREAKIATAQLECEELAKGETMCGLQHNFYVPLQVLDDIRTELSNRDPQRVDDLLNEDAATIQLINTDINVYQQNGFQSILITNSSDQRVARMESDWGGPFVQLHRTFFSIPNPSGQYQRRDFPLDPWNNPYRLYAPSGITGSTAGTNTTPVTPGDVDNDSFSNGNLTGVDRRFDRFAVVSFGPDGLSDGLNPTINADDIIYLFGDVVQRTDTVFP